MEIYNRIAANKRNSILLFILFFLFVLALGYVFGLFLGIGYFGVIIAFVIAIFLIWISYYKSDSLVLKISRAREVKPNEYPFLENSVEGLALAAGIPKPRLYVIDDSAPNAFATGRNPEKAVICVTTGLLKKLNRLELEGVIAHEMSHIKNYDIRFMILVAVMVGVVALLSHLIIRTFIWGSFYGGRGGGRKGGGGIELAIIAVGIILAILTPIIAQLIRFAISRKREFLADADGALLTRYPKGLADALRKISSDKEELEAANPATEHLYISNPFKGKAKGFFTNLFNTHPPIQERIKALEGM
ncbi:MAG: M48 family metallopeptidase [archaeon]